MLGCKQAQGFDVEALRAELSSLPDSYDKIAEFGDRIANAPLRAGWPYVEPNDLEGIWAECNPNRPNGLIRRLSQEEAAARAEAAFYAAVAGCMLGKPLEVNPTLAEIRAAGEAVGEWPLTDYISEAMLAKLGRRHPSADETTRGRIQYVAPDDDMNYSIIGMLLLERYGLKFSKANLFNVWLHNLPPLWTWGPERTILIKAATYSMHHDIDEATELLVEEWAGRWNPSSEACGAAIRVDSYGYACPGNPALAAELAWRDASCTHRRTGIYGAMFIAAAIATAFVATDRLEIFETALQFVPQRSRFYEIISDCLQMVREASDWLDGYKKINQKYNQYQHCAIYQEVATMINTLRFAPNVDEGICMQVAQGNDTDCFGEIAGSLLGAYFGPGSLSSRWLSPFNDEIHTALANFYEQSLSNVARRMGALTLIGLQAA
jgi:ADP-ribosylglycohydrolase